MKAKDKMILSFGGLAAFTLVVAAGSALTPKASSRHVKATVVQIYTAGARFPHTVVIARAPGTMDAHGLIQYEAENHCRIGDIVDGEQAGITLTVDARTCRPPQTSSTSRP